MYILALIPALVLLGQVRNLKYLVPFSMLANICMMTGFAITLYYIFDGVAKKDKIMDDIKLFSSLEQLPRFFATVIFAIEGIGVVSSTLTIYLHAPRYLTFFPSFTSSGPFATYLVFFKIITDSNPARCCDCR